MVYTIEQLTEMLKLAIDLTLLGEGVHPSYYDTCGMAEGHNTALTNLKKFEEENDDDRF